MSDQTVEPECLRKSHDIKILNQLIDDETGGIYRIMFHRRIRYVTITPGVFDDDTLARPYLLIPSLPELPLSEWTRLSISRKANGEFELTPSFSQIPALSIVWHPKNIDLADFERVVMHKSGVHEVMYEGKPAITKIACWDRQLSEIDREMMAYDLLDLYEENHPEAASISPKFIANLTENGQARGLLLEYINGRTAEFKDLNICETALRELHTRGLIHGDVNRHNIPIDSCTSQVKLIDFSDCELYEEAKAASELASLRVQFAEEGQRGASLQIKANSISTPSVPESPVQSELTSTISSDENSKAEIAPSA